MIKLKDIKNYMVNSLDYEPISLDEYPYDIDGHCGDGLYEEIKEFWTKFRTKSDFEFVVTGRFMNDDIDLSGGRSYLLSDDKLIDMLFDYMTNVLKWTKEEYQEKIHNSLGITEELEDRYDSINNVGVDDNSTKKVNVWKNLNLEEYDYIPEVVMYHKNRKEELDSCESIEFIGESLINKNRIAYKIKTLGVKIPKDYEIIEPLDEILKRG